ncbi:hypothetical protein PS865_04478 [Pseudomonas fluorescens]|nr:hypothetical protein PS865_04478 [Pseudomonas fluorescens]
MERMAYLRAWRNERFDAVITDCNMPLMNGYSLARAIRDEEKCSGLISPDTLISGKYIY